MDVKFYHLLLTLTIQIYFADASDYVDGENWIKPITDPMTHSALAPSIKRIAVKNHTGIVVCKIFLKGRNSEDDDNWYDSEVSFDANLCTHMVYSYIYITKDYKFTEDGKLREVEKIQKILSQFPHLKILAHIEIHNLEKHYFMKNLTGSSGNKHLFIKNMISHLKNLSMDGLYIGSVFHEYSNIIGSSYDFTMLLKETKKEFQREGLLLATEIDLFRYSREVMDTTFHSVAQLSRILDFVFLKGFDSYRSGDGIAGYYAPLFSLNEGDENINDNLNYLLYTMGANPNTLILTISFYGQKHELMDADGPLLGFHSSTSFIELHGYEYNKICLFNWNTYWDSRAHVPFIKNGKEWISFENPLSVYDKVQLANKYGLRGIMAQSIDADDFRGKCVGNITYPLLRIINYVQFTNEERKQKNICPFSPKDYLSMPVEVFVDFYIYDVFNNSITVNCTANGNPRPEITWHKINDEEEQHPNGLIKYFSENECLPYKISKSTLEIPNFTSNEEGKYLCRGENSNGQSEATFFVTFQDNPLIVNDGNIWIQKTNTAMIFQPDLVYTSDRKREKEKPIFCMYDSKIDNSLNRHKVLNSNFGDIIDEGLCNYVVYTNLYLDTYSYEIKLEDEDQVQLIYLTNFSTTASEFKVILGISFEECDRCDSKTEFVKALTTSERSIRRFKRSMKNTMNRLNTSGLLLDLSFCITPEIDMLTFGMFLKELKLEFKGLLLLIQVDHIFYKQLDNEYRNHEWSNSYFKQYQLYDFIFLTAYNFYQADHGITNHNAPIKSLNSKQEKLYSYLNRLKHYHSLILVIPFFGRRYTLNNQNATLYGLHGRTNDAIEVEGPLLNGSEIWGYNEICHSLLRDQHWNLYWDYIANVPFSKNGNLWISFENPKSVSSKANIVSDAILGGIAVNSINFDDHEGKCGGVKYPLLRAARAGLRRSARSINFRDILPFLILGAVIVLILSLVIAVVYLIIRGRKIKGLTRKEILYFKKGTAEANDYDDPTSRPYDASYEINNNYQIDKKNILGSGAYGIVYSGLVKDTPAAVKCTKPGADKQYLMSLLSEIKILIHLGHHPNIMNLIGASTVDLKKGIVYLFVELCPLGNLQNYLRNSCLIIKESKKNENMYSQLETNESQDTESKETEKEKESENKLTFWNLVNWTHQIANGLQYLSSKKLVHGDLAARNVLLFEKDVVKLNDFGLSRKLYDYNEYVKKNQEPLPWRWMALESLRHMTFSVQSDIWSFGITAWEIFSLGETPYPGLSWTVDFVDELGRNMRVQKPKHATNEIYGFMLECWSENPNDRPKPEDVTAYFSSLAKIDE